MAAVGNDLKLLWLVVSKLHTTQLHASNMIVVCCAIEILNNESCLDKGSRRYFADIHN